MENNGARLATPEAEALAALSVAAVKGEATTVSSDGLSLKRL